MRQDHDLELAECRVRIAELESTVAAIHGMVGRLVEHITRDSVARVMRQEEQREREAERRRRHINALVGALGPGCIETVAARIERVFAGERGVPDGAAKAVDYLRNAYGVGGPSRATIRRAFSKLSNECANGASPENQGHTNLKGQSNGHSACRPERNPNP